MKIRASAVVFLVTPLLISGYSYRDHTHYSSVFQEARHFRVFYPPSYNSSPSKTYPVIYYLHGCRGSYLGDQYSSYIGDGNYVHPYNCSGSGCDPVMNDPFNADFQMYVDSHEVIVVMVDGKLYATSGCDCWVPYELDPNWTGNEYDFARYFPELFRTVDSLYRTKASTQYRAITGLSMGGDEALLVSAERPDLFRSTSSFCYSCSFKTAGAAPYLTVTDPQQYWRNYRGHSLRTHANDQDYLYQYSQQMGVLLEGAGFANEYHQIKFFRHWAADVDSQFDFHVRTFATPKPNPACFTYATLYPSADVWGYRLTSSKAEEGWLYLRDVTKSSLGIHTRFRFPYGLSLSKFPVTLTTPGLYGANAQYAMVAYDYRKGAFSSGNITASGAGALAVSDSGGLGREYGFSGNGLEPALALLADTVNDAIFIKAGHDTALSFELANLSTVPLSGVRVIAKTENPFLSLVKSETPLPSVPAMSKVRLDSLAVIRGTYTRWNNIGYIQVRFAVNGDTLDKETILQIHVMDSIPLYDSLSVTVYEDGGQVAFRSVDTGHIYSMSVTYPYQDVPDNYQLMAPIVPINGQDNPGVSFLNYQHYSVNRAREVVEAKFRLNRHPTLSNPVAIPFMIELAYYDPSPGSDRGVDVNVYRYGRIILPYGSIGIEGVMPSGEERLSLSVFPNPFYSATRIRVKGISGRSAAALSVFSLDGKKVRTFDPRSFGAGGSVSWKGSDDQGLPLPSGIYLLRATHRGGVAQRKVVNLR